MSRRDVKFAQHYVECTQCEANAEHYCNTCTDNLCQVCRDRHTKSNATRSHVIVPYQERPTISPNTESCHLHPEFSYDMACQECKLPVCFRCMKENHKGHTFKNIEDTLKDTEKPCRDKIQNAKKNILPKLRDHLKKLSDQRTKSKEKRTDIRRRLREDAKQIKDLVDTILQEKLGDLDNSDKSLDEEFENQTAIISRFISNYEDFIDGFDDEEKQPYEKLALRNEILQSEVTEPELPSLENPQYQPEIINKDGVMKLFGKLSMPKKSTAEKPKVEISKKLDMPKDISIGSPVKCLRFDMPAKDLRQISCVSVDKVWVGDNEGQIMLMEKTGNKLDEIKTDSSSMWGYHAVTYDGDLLYIDKSNNSIKKYTSDRKLKTTTVITTTGKWWPLCVYSSHRTGDILVGMIKDNNNKRVVRYNKEGRELWQSQYDAQGQPLYDYPKYITENVNGDICTSDGGSNEAVVVVDRDGNHRFSYRGRQDESKFNPYGICTDVHGRILVIVKQASVHMIDQNGEFITVLLTRDHGIFNDSGLCTDSDNNIWLCGDNGVKMYKYLN
ncbi:uncharacterized protein LOC125658222 [Ostrea edulis]|uniref:uncharacterized protein LOC125658222 n=1 Tax=Ostrea edulis TaxID=37623 RepID=UPI0024AEB06B|nr:uncharacterized protein LOC125658222 [Ostrea edulis]XP_056006552.1 uncharacterized protein LOC125658222 [Ostrea edulis]